MNIDSLLQSLGVPAAAHQGGKLASTSPIDGGVLAHVPETALADVAAIIERAHSAYGRWRTVPAPLRGELVRLFGEELRASKEPLARLVSLEVGKIRSEALGEVQEMIDICDFAVGLSRQLYGLTIASERRGHRMMETWHPLGVVGIITAFNFPVAVLAWNAALALVCGDPVVWKPSEKAPLCALAVRAVFERARRRWANPEQTADLMQVLIGRRDIGEAMVVHSRVALLSATGSTRMGRDVGARVAARFGRCLLELGGNNAIVVGPTADLDLTVRAVVFSAAGTTGQRCTTARRLIVHEDVHDRLLQRLKHAYQSVAIGSPLEEETLLGPLIDGHAFEAMQNAITDARSSGGKVFGGQRVLAETLPDAYYVKPALIEMAEQSALVMHETFAPILYVLKYRVLSDAIAINNAVPQGLSSSIFTSDLREAELFMSAVGSDCGIANVNIGTSGAEIGGAFGGEKETGGGRESGSDAWRNYMRRATNTVNYSGELPLAQGVRFDVVA